MGRLSFADAVYLLLMGELPTPAIGRMLNAILVSSIDHGVTPPSTLAARNVAATRGAAEGLRGGRHPRLRAASRRRHRDVHAVSRSRAGADAQRRDRCRRRPSSSSTNASRRTADAAGLRPRLHTRDPRAARLFQMALELELEGEHVRMMRAIEQALEARRSSSGARCRSTWTAPSPRSRADLGSRTSWQRDLPDLAAARPDRACARGADAATADAADRSEGSRLRRVERAALPEGRK